MPEPVISLGRALVGSKPQPKAAKEVFTNIYQTNFWNDDQSVSGTGSNLVQTQKIVEEIPALLKKYGIKSMLDVPCGDFNWMSRIDLTGIDYTGADIVDDIVEKCQQQFAAPNISFRTLNLIEDPLPEVDLLLVRDCLVHFPNEMVDRALVNIFRSNIKYLLVTSFRNRTENPDIPFGKWRPLNLELAPHSLKPIEIIDENCTEENGKYADKVLMLVKIK